MLNAELYPAIFTRKSVREFRDEALNQEDLSALRRALAEISPIRNGIPIELVLWPRDKPSLILAYCEDTPLGRANVGFMIQQLDLFLHLRGMGGFWYGMGKEPKGLARGPLKFAVCYKFGYPKGNAKRESVSEFNRGSIDEVVEGPNAPKWVEAVRLAPSALNAQPWFVEIRGSIAILTHRRGNHLKEVLLKKMNQIGMGIALCHGALAMSKENGHPPVIALTREEAKKAGGNVILFQPE